MKWAIAVLQAPKNRVGFHAGVMVDATVTAYGDCAEGAIVCPFCHEPVFWRRGHERRQGDRLVPVASQFSHYSVKRESGEDCEIRSSRPDGQRYIAKLKRESKGQRIALFTQRFESIFFDFYGIEKRSIRQLEQVFGKKWIKDKCSSIRRSLAERLKESDYPMSQIDQFINVTNDVSVLDGLSDLYGQSEAQMAKDALNSLGQDLKTMDEILHKQLCAEVIEIMARSTGAAILRLVFLILLGINVQSTVNRGGSRDDIELKTHDFWLDGILGVIIQTRWINQLK